MERCPVMESSRKKELDEGVGVMNESDEFSTTRVTRTALTDNGVVSERVFGRFKFGFLYTCYKDVFLVEMG